LAFVVNPIQSFPTNTVVRARFVFALHGFILALIGEQQTLVDICGKDIAVFQLMHKSEAALHEYSQDRPKKTTRTTTISSKALHKEDYDRNHTVFLVLFNKGKWVRGSDIK